MKAARTIITVALLLLLVLAVLLLAFCPKPKPPGKPVPAGAPHDPTQSTQEIHREAD